MNNRKIRTAAIFSTTFALAGTFITLAIIAIWHTPRPALPNTPLAGALAAYLTLCAIGAALRSRNR